MPVAADACHSARVTNCVDVLGVAGSSFPAVTGVSELGMGISVTSDRDVCRARDAGAAIDDLNRDLAQRLAGDQDRVAL